MRREKGFTLIEIVVVLAIIAVIAAFLTPMLFDYLKESKVSRAKADVTNIAAAIANFNRDLQVYPVYYADTTQSSAGVKVLKTNEGNEATLVTVTGWDGTAGTVTVQLLENALQAGMLADGTHLYRNSSQVSANAVVKKPGEWKGPYMTDFKADPWGNKYYVSTQGLWPFPNPGAVAGTTATVAAFVLSAGPDGRIETVLYQDLAAGATAFVVGGDDIAYRIR